MDKSLRTIGLTALAFIGYRAYKLYEMGNLFDFEFYGMKFQRPANWQEALNKYQVVLIFKVNNPTRTSLTMKGLEGSVREDTNIIAKFKTGKFTIKGGESFINVVADLEPKYVAYTLIPALVSKIPPVFDIKITPIFPFGIRYTTDFKINTKDYIPKDYQAFFN